LETSFIRYDVSPHLRNSTSGLRSKPRAGVHRPAWNRFNVPNGDKGQRLKEHPPSLNRKVRPSAETKQLKSLPLRQQPLSQSHIHLSVISTLSRPTLFLLVITQNAVPLAILDFTQPHVPSLKSSPRVRSNDKQEDDQPRRC